MLSAALSCSALNLRTQEVSDSSQALIDASNLWKFFGGRLYAELDVVEDE